MTKRTIFKAILDIFRGIAIGIGAILPGISGGVLAIVFGIYKPTMNFLAHPIRNKNLLQVLIPAGIGGILGMVLFAGLVEWLFKTQYGLAVWLFIGLIGGTLPGVWKEAGRYTRGASSFVALLVSFAVLTAALLLLNRSGSVNILPSTLWWVICGALWGIGLIVPGLSHSSLLVFLGLYEPMAAGIAALDMSVIIPMVLGLGATLLLLARLVKRIFDKAPAIAYHCILGVIVASTIAIIPPWQGGAHLLPGAAMFVLGLGISLLMGKLEGLNPKHTPSQSEGSPE